MHKNTQIYTKMPTYAQINPNMHKNTQICTNIPKYAQIYPNMHKNTQIISNIYKNDQICTKMPKYAQKCPNIHKNTQICTKILCHQCQLKPLPKKTEMLTVQCANCLGTYFSILVKSITNISIKNRGNDSSFYQICFVLLSRMGNYVPRQFAHYTGSISVFFGKGFNWRW